MIIFLPFPAGFLMNRACDFSVQAAEMKKKRTFRKYTYRGVDLDQLLDMNNEQLMELFPCRIRRKFSRGLKRKPMALIKKLRKKKKEAPPNEKPDVVKTHLRDMIIVPEMTGSVVGVYNGKTFNQVEIKVKSLPNVNANYVVNLEPLVYVVVWVEATGYIAVMLHCPCGRCSSA